MIPLWHFILIAPSFVASAAFLLSSPGRAGHDSSLSKQQRNDLSRLLIRIKQQHPHRIPHRHYESTSLWAGTQQQQDVREFDLSTALLCGGLAFDAYVEPAANSSRWERGSGGLAVAYSSRAFARQLYKGILEVKVEKITGLPETESNQAERLISGDGVDACLLVAVVEGQWKEDVEILEKEQYHEGVLDLTGAAHVSRSTTCWSTVTKAQAETSEQINGKPLPYFVPKTWNRLAQAVWPPKAQRSSYLYVQDPATARLVFTVIDDDRLGSGLAVGSTHKRLTDLIPEAGYDPNQLISSMKDQIVTRLSRGGKVDPEVINNYLANPENLAPKWNGELPLTSKPRKRNKNSQIMAGAAAGAYLAGPVGAAAGALIANFYEGQVQGRIHLDIRYLPTAISALPERQVYPVKGGLPGTDWGALYHQHRKKSGLPAESAMQDLEHCFFVSHEKTGATCSVYRSIAYQQLIVSFRGTCAPIDLLTDASLVQDAWVEGEDVADQSIVKVHRGFRSSLNSISRRLKELLLAAPEGNIADYDMLVTGHSLGGALATLFTADIAEFGIDAGRALPQLKASDPWWKSVAKTLGVVTSLTEKEQAPPRPKTLQLYNFGSPRVGNLAFATLFDRLLQEGNIDCAYRIVNGEDIVARLPRTVNGLVLGKINYDHVGKTVLVNAPEFDADGNEIQTNADVPSRLWIEGISDDKKCPIRDGTSLSSPMAPGMLLQELIEAATNDSSVEPKSWTDRFSAMAGKVTERIKTIKASELANIIGIDTSFTDREVRIFQSLLQGKAVSHHLEDQYYGGMGKASGFLARVGAEIVDEVLGNNLKDALILAETTVTSAESENILDNVRHDN